MSDWHPLVWVLVVVCVAAIGWWPAGTKGE